VQLFVDPIVGLADNGDFIRIMKPVGLTYGPHGWRPGPWRSKVESWKLRD
jgi:hypothetical protein